MALSRKELLARRRQAYRASRAQRLKEATDYRVKNRDAILARRRLHYLANRENRLEEASQYRTKNREKVRAAVAAWYKANGAANARERYRRNPEPVLSASRKWCAKNPDYHRQHALAAYYADIEVGRAKCRASRAANVEQRRLDYREWAKNNRGAIREIARRRRARKLAATVERFDENEIFERDGWRCYICDAPVSLNLPAVDPARAILEHVISLARGGSHSRDNTRCACFRCNGMKGAHLTPEQVRARLREAGIEVGNARQASNDRP